MHYRIYGLQISTDTPLPELGLPRDEGGAGADVRVRLTGRPRELPRAREWFAHWTLPSGEPWLACGRCEGGYRLRFHRLAEFHVDSEGQEVIGAPRPTTPPHTLRHLLLDQVLPLVLNLRGRQALHAAAVLTERGVCAFTGSAGAGKSTLAASFRVAGYPVVSDDCLVLEEERGAILARPGYPGLRLWRDAVDALGDGLGGSGPVAHYTSKRRVLTREIGRELRGRTHPVARIYSLVRPAEPADGHARPRIEPLSAREGFAELLPFAFRLDITDQAMLRRQFHLLGRLASRVPVRRLLLPGALAMLPAVREAIGEDLAAEPGRSPEEKAAC